MKDQPTLAGIMQALAAVRAGTEALWAELEAERAMEARGHGPRDRMARPEAATLLK